MRDIAKLGLILFIITAVSAAILAAANEATVEPIKLAQEKSNNEARQEVLSTATSFEALSKERLDEIAKEDDRVKEIYIGNDESGNIVGYTIKSVSSGYGGELEIITGISVEGKITGMKVVSHSETPGLGANSATPEFQNQFIDKSATASISVSKSAPKENEIQAISGATITSTAVSDGVNVAIEAFNKIAN